MHQRIQEYHLPCHGSFRDPRIVSAIALPFRHLTVRTTHILAASLSLKLQLPLVCLNTVVRRHFDVTFDQYPGAAKTNCC